jgi:hypothetical protein
VNWTGIELTHTNRPADNTLRIENCGNTNISDEAGTAFYLAINATKLLGYPHDQNITASNFTGNDLTSPYCSTTDFTEAQWYNLTFFMDRGQGYDELGFCLRQVPGYLLVPQNFTTIHDWDIQSIQTP